MATGICCKISWFHLVESWSKQEGDSSPLPNTTAPLGAQEQAVKAKRAEVTPQDTPGWGNCQEFQSDIPSKKISFQQNDGTLHLGFCHLASREFGKKQSGWVLEVLVGELNWSSSAWLCQSKQDNTPKEK